MRQCSISFSQLSFKKKYFVGFLHHHALNLTVKGQQKMFFIKPFMYNLIKTLKTSKEKVKLR